MRLLLSTFSSLREELLHMSEDLRVRPARHLLKHAASQQHQS